MAIHQHAREDLLLEATAYFRRAMIRPVGLAFRGVPIVELFVGCRASGGWSLYYDETPVLQFNSQGLLRRLVVGGSCLLAEKGQLLRLERQSLGGRVQPVRLPLSSVQTESLVTELEELLAKTKSILTVGWNPGWLVGQHSEAADSVVIECARWLEGLPKPLGIADRPNAIA